MQPDYKMIALLLTGNHVETSPAQVHGLLTGQLCSGSDQPTIDTIEQLLEQAHSFSPVVNKLIERLIEEATTQLGELELHFQPLLPTDEANLEDRVGALGNWCDGFMVGFSAGFIKPESSLSAEAREILSDFMQLADVGENTEDLNDQDEVDFMELVEYVRVATVTLYDQLGALALPDPASEHDLHMERPDNDMLH